MNQPARESPLEDTRRLLEANPCALVGHDCVHGPYDRRAR